MSESPIEKGGARYEVIDQVAQLTFTRAKAMNTMTAESFGSWMHFTQVANDDPKVGAMLVRAEGRAFCAGADLKTFLMPKLTGQEPFIENDPYLGGLGLPGDMVSLFRQSKPIVVAIQGMAIGGGITSVLPCDYLIASTEATFSFPFTKIGITPELCSSQYLARRVGFGRASELLLSARTLSAEEAKSINLIEDVVAPEALDEAAMEKAKVFAKNATEMQILTKQLLTENYEEADLTQVWARESKALAHCVQNASVMKNTLKNFAKK